MNEANARERTVPYYACKHGVPGGCAFCNATEEKPRAGEHVPESMRWLLSHCYAIGMTKQSDSGLPEHDIALFTADLEAERGSLRERERELVEALEGLIGKIEVMNGCNSYDFDEGAEEEWPEFQLARALLAKHGR